jgi:hypothetical protein
MTIKQKFSSIDQSKLTADQKAFLDKIKNVTKNFTDAEMNKKVETPLDNFIAKAKDKMPEAIKSAPVKRTAKAKTSQTRKPKRTAMSLAKEIRKEGESWKDAQVRARKMMKEDSQSLSKTVESELDKLTKLVRSQKDKEKLAGISGTDIKRDAVRKAKPRGARKVTRSGETSNQYGTYKNHLGRKYYESRDRHSDRLAPRYPKNAPLLESGAYLTDGTFGNFQNQVFAEGGDIDAFTLRMVKSNGMQPAEVLKEDANVKYNRGGSVTNERRYVNKGEDYEVRYSRPILRRKGYQGKRDFMAGGRVESLTKELYRLQRELNSSRLQTYRLGDNSQEAMDRKNEREVKLARFNEVLKELRESDAKFELGGVMATDLAGHTGGGTGGLNAGMPLDGFSNTAYTGLVGETGAMSSGEMFMAGGSIDKNFDLSGYKKYRTFNDLEEAKQYVDMDRKKYPRVKESVVIKEGNRFQVWVVPATGIETGNRVYELGGGLPSGASQSYMITESLGNPAQHFAKGGGVVTHNGREYSLGRNWTNDFRHVNKAEEHEVLYNRKGKFLGIFKEGGAIKNQYAGRTPEDIWDSLSVEQRKHFLIDHSWGNQEQIEQIKYSRLEEEDKEFVNYYAIRTWKKLSGDVRKAFTSHVKEGEYNKGGAIENQYAGRTPEDIWNNLNQKQKYHFLQDHRNEFPTFKNDLYELPFEEYDKLPRKIELSFKNHVLYGEYNKGGALTNERKHVNHDEDYEVRYAKPRPKRKGYNIKTYDNG